MLTLTRRSTQSIHIGDHVTLTILSIKGDRVRIGINAPDAIEIHRPERLDKLKPRFPAHP